MTPPLSSIQRRPRHRLRRRDPRADRSPQHAAPKPPAVALGERPVLGAGYMTVSETADGLHVVGVDERGDVRVLAYTERGALSRQRMTTVSSDGMVCYASACTVTTGMTVRLGGIGTTTASAPFPLWRVSP